MIMFAFKNGTLDTENNSPCKLHPVRVKLKLDVMTPVLYKQEFKKQTFIVFALNTSYTF